MRICNNDNNLRGEALKTIQIQVICIRKVITNVTPSRTSIEESKRLQRFSDRSLYFLLCGNLIVKVKLSVSINEKLSVSIKLLV